MPEADNKALVLQYYQEFDRGNLDKLKIMLAEDFVAYMPGISQPLDSQSFLEFAQTMRVAFPDLRHSFAEAIAAGDTVVTRGTFSGTHRGSLSGLPATGKSVTVSFIHIDKIAGGKIIAHWGQADTMRMLQQVDVVPLPLAIVKKLGAIAAVIALGIFLYFAWHA